MTRPWALPRRARAMVLLLGVAMAAAACGNEGASPGAARPGGAATTSPGALGSLSPTAGTTGPSASGQGSPRAAVPSGSPGSSAVGPSPSPFPTPWTPEIPVQAWVEPACVLRGGTATITVVTQPKAGVAYHAVYAGTKGGAPPPFGHGYGGDNKGFTDGEGRFSSSWIVSPQAPVGPARVDVIVGWDEKWGYAGPGFAVAGPSGTC